MNLDKYRREHADIIGHVQQLKTLCAQGIAARRQPSPARSSP
jgi:hypothetical protein